MINWEEYRQHLQDEAEARRKRDVDRKENQNKRNAQKMTSAASPNSKEYAKRYYERHKDEIYKKTKDYHRNYQREHADEINAKNRERRKENKPVRYVIFKNGETIHCKNLQEVSKTVGVPNRSILGAIKRNGGVWAVNGYEIVDLNSSVICETKLWPKNLSIKVFGNGIVIRDPEEFMDGLKDRERDVLLFRYRDHQTLEDVGEKYGITKERVRQIENKAIEKLKRKARVE